MELNHFDVKGTLRCAEYDDQFEISKFESQVRQIIKISADPATQNGGISTWPLEFNSI